MKCVLIFIVGFLFVRWNITAIAESPSSIINLLLAVGAGLALGMYLVRVLFDAVNTPHREYTWNSSTAYKKGSLT